MTDQALNISASIDEFMLKFVMALGVVLVVSLIALSWRVGIVVALAVPLTLAVVFLVMLDTGRFFDRITLGALILSLGLLVDDTIIAIEVMVVKMEEGMDRIEAAAFARSHTAAPMLSGTLVTVIGLMPVGFSLIASWFVAVAFTPYLGVKFLPDIKPIEGGVHAIYDTPNYRRLRAVITAAVRHKFLVCILVALAFAASIVGMSGVKQQFFPTSDRPEVLVEVRLPEGTSIEATTKTVERLEAWLQAQPEAELVSSYIGQGAPRFSLAMSPETPDPAFAKIVILTENAETREVLKHRMREAVAQGLAPEAFVRVTQLVFGPYTPFPVEFRVMGPNPEELVHISAEALSVMRSVPDVRQANRDWGSRSPVLRFILDQDLGLVGAVPILLAFDRPFGFNAVLGMIGLAGILMRNTLILIEQIKENKHARLDDDHAVIEATVQRTRPVILTALAAVLAFIPLTHSVFWGSMAYTLIGARRAVRC